MANNYDSPFNGLGPFQNMFKMNPGQFSPPAAMEQFMRGMARWQIETQSLMSRRAQAYLEVPGRVAQCRTPQDLMQEQAQFWQTAFQQYSEASRRIMTAWAQAAQMPAEPNKAADTGARERDYLSFSDNRAASQRPNGTAAGHQRRVA